MKYCQKCGAQLSDDTNFCTKCGAVQSAAYKAPEQPAPQPKSNGKTVVIVLLVCFVLILGGVVAYLLLGKSGKTGAETGQETTPAATQQTETTPAATTPAETAAVETTAAVPQGTTLDSFVGIWVGSERWSYTVDKDGDSVRVSYQGSNGANSGMSGQGIGRMQGTELIVTMTYSDYRYDNQGNKAVRDHQACTDRVMQVADVASGYALNTNDYILKNEARMGGQNYNCYDQQLSACIPAEDYVIWTYGDSFVDEYILWYSSENYLEEADISMLDQATLRIARNEIYARHGRKFNSEDLSRHFNNCSWYQGTIDADKFDVNVLSPIEKANVELIERYENAQKSGGRTEPLKGLVQDDIYGWWKQEVYYNTEAQHNTYSDAYNLGDWAGNVIVTANQEMMGLSRTIGNRYEWLFGTDTGNNITNNFRYYYAYYYSLKDYYNSNGQNSSDVYNRLKEQYISWGSGVDPDGEIKRLFNDLQPMITASNNAVRAKRK